MSSGPHSGSSSILPQAAPTTSTASSVVASRAGALTSSVALQGSASDHERVVERSRTAEKDMGAGELTAHGFGEKFVDGMESGCEHHERARGDCRSRNENGPHVVNLKVQDRSSQRKIRTSCVGMTGASTRGSFEGAVESETRWSRSTIAPMTVACSKAPPAIMQLAGGMS